MALFLYIPAAATTISNVFQLKSADNIPNPNIATPFNHRSGSNTTSCADAACVFCNIKAMLYSTVNILNGGVERAEVRRTGQLDAARVEAHACGMSQDINGAPVPARGRRVDAEVAAALSEATRRLLSEAIRPVDPTAIARAVGGSSPEGWGPLMQPLRLVLVQLAHDGVVTIVRKGKPVDPGQFKGIYRVTRGPAFEA